MYYILKSLLGTKAFYIFQNREYIVGRKECDILIKDDTSISRKHALLTIKVKRFETPFVVLLIIDIYFQNGKLYIKDLGAKYKTFINNVEVNASEVIELNINDEIKFGILNSVYMYVLRIHFILFIITINYMDHIEAK